jgi:hypothetical protein
MLGSGINGTGAMFTKPFRSRSLLLTSLASRMRICPGWMATGSAGLDGFGGDTICLPLGIH